MTDEEQIQIVLNGEPHSVSASRTVLDLLKDLNLKSRFVAVERNKELVPRAFHAECTLNDGDAIEIVTLVGGG